MNTIEPVSRYRTVIAASAVIVILAGLLGARLLARPAPATRTVALAPSAFVPDPMPIPEGGIEVPNWGHREARDWPVEFHTNLDLLAPLGDGPANAADWFMDFTKGAGPSGGPDWMQDTGPEARPGPRYAEAVAAVKSRVDGPEWLGKIFPPDHPLLLEAEPWCDQATMKFYPNIFPIDGYLTRIPNLLFPLNLARSWVARGIQSENPEKALADMRRAIRLGRLLRQDDATIIADLVGLACIQIGAEGIYRHAVSEGDLELALVASIVLGEYAAQRLMTTARVTQGSVADSFFKEDHGKIRLRISDTRLDKIIAMATSGPETRFRGEGLISLAAVRHLGTDDQKARAVEVLDELSGSDDWMTAELAKWCRDFELTDEVIAEFSGIPE